MALFFFFFALVVLPFKVSNSAEFTLQNRCRETICPGIQDNTQNPPMNGGFQLNPDESIVVEAPVVWSGGRFWARTGCTFDPSGSNGRCITGDCGGSAGKPPVSLAEFTLGSTPVDFYDVSLVDGFNIPVSNFPHGGFGNCSAVSCTADLNDLCPEELRVRRDGGGGVVACKSACIAFGEERFCCAGEYNSPRRCGPSRYSEVFKMVCPTVYSYVFDDATSTFTCTGASYSVVFS